MITFADYYPFGEKLPTRDNITGNYRYAYQGQELDGETGMEAFQLRLWDGRIGRWLNPDPYGQYASPYLGMGNNPVNRINPDGGTDGGPGDPEIPAILSGNPNQSTPVYGPQPENLPVHNLAPITISATVCRGERVASAGFTNTAFTGIGIGLDNFQSNLDKLSKIKNFEPTSFSPSGSYEFKKIASGINDGKIYLEGTGESLNALKTLSKTARFASYGAAGVGFLLSVKEFNEKKISGELLALDGVMTVVSFAGPVGAGVGAVYFILIRTDTKDNYFTHKVEIDNTRTHLKIHKFTIK